ncbi:MAG: hypothetical protein AB1592_06835 [Pseudomonadota bacterium]
MTSTLLDLTAVAVAGIALTGAVLSFGVPKAYLAPAGEPGLGIAMSLETDTFQRTAATRFGGDKGSEKADPAWASFPRAF